MRGCGGRAKAACAAMGAGARVRTAVLSSAAAAAAATNVNANAVSALARVSPRAHLTSVSKSVPHRKSSSLIDTQFPLTHSLVSHHQHHVNPKVRTYSKSINFQYLLSRNLLNSTTRSRLHFATHFRPPLGTVRMASTTPDTPEWSAQRVRDTFLEFFEKQKDHTFGRSILCILDMH
jgi:hypothetical protein